MPADKSPTINIDLGASAKAEIKAEVPSSSMGRLVDALTDVIRPFTERRGLRADEIRLQREDVLIEIAKKAIKRLEIEQRQPEPIQNRVLIPMLEKASLTDAADEKLVDAWANLMASASKGPNANHVIYVDILSKLDSIHLRYMEQILSPAGITLLDQFGALAVEIDDHIHDILAKYILKNGISEEINKDFSSFFSQHGTLLLNGILDLSEKGSIKESYNIKGNFDGVTYPGFVSGALESLNLIERRRHEEHRIMNVDLRLEYHALSSFGVSFFSAFHCEAAN